MLRPFVRLLVGVSALLGCSSPEAPRNGAGSGGAGATGVVSSGGSLGSGADTNRGGGAGTRSAGGSGATGAGGVGVGAGAGGAARSAGGTAPASSGGTGNVGGDATAEAGMGASDNGGTSGSGGMGAGRMCVSHAIDLLAPAVSGKITINGAAITDMNDGVGSLSLSNAAGDYAPLGYLPGSSYSALVAPGTYDLYFSGESGSKIPVLGFVKLRSGVVVGTEPFSLDVDVPTTTVSTKVTLNGAAIPDQSSGDGDGYLELRNGTDARIDLAYLIGGTQSALAFPGTYDLYYSVFSRVGDTIPTNTSAKVQSGIVIGSSPVSLKIDIPFTKVSASATVAGAPITGAAKQFTFLWLVNDDGDTAELTVTSSTGESSALVIPGTYDLYYSAYGDTCGVPRVDCVNLFAPNVPKNSYVKLKSGIVVGTSPVSLQVDLPATTLSGNVSVNGVPVTGLDTTGLLTLTTAAGDTVELSPDTSGAYSELVLPGTYDLVYRINGYPRDNMLGALPTNLMTKLQSGIVVGTSPLTFDIDIPATTVTGSVTLNGAMLPPSTSKDDGDGWISLLNADGAWVSLGSLRAGSFSAPVIRGTYDVAYSAATDSLGNIGAGVPINASTTLERKITVGASPLVLNVDVPAVPIAGTVTVNGVVIDDFQKSGSGALLLTSPGSPNDSFTRLASLTSDSDAATGAYSALVIPGSYELYFNDYSSGPLVPGNEHVDLGCFEAR